MQNGVEIMRLAGDVVVDAVNHDEVLIALQRKVAAVEIGRIQHIALRIRVLHIGGQPVGDADIGGELFIVILVCIPGQDRLADPVELFGAAGKPGGLVNPRAAGLQILNGESSFGLTRSTVAVSGRASRYARKASRSSGCETRPKTLKVSFPRSRPMR